MITFFRVQPGPKENSKMYLKPLRMYVRKVNKKDK